MTRPSTIRAPLAQPPHAEVAAAVPSGPFEALEVSARPLAAAALILLGSAIVAGTTVLAKALGTDALGPPLHPLQIAQGRFMFALCGVALACLFLRPRIIAPAVPLHFLRATSGYLTVALLFAAATMIPLADATAISFLSPIVTMVLAAFVLRERVRASRWFAAAIALAGAFVLLRPGAGALSVGALLALLSALTMGVELTVVKRLTRREGLLQILIFSNVFGTLLSTIGVIMVVRMPTPAQWAGLASLGLLMLCAQICYVRAMRLADASFVAPVAYTTLIFAAAYDIAIFSAWPDLVSLAGAGLILVGAVVLTTRERR